MIQQTIFSQPDHTNPSTSRRGHLRSPVQECTSLFLCIHYKYELKLESRFGKKDKVLNEDKKMINGMIKGDFFESKAIKM